jgi:hypothetical protein
MDEDDEDDGLNAVRGIVLGIEWSMVAWGIVVIVCLALGLCTGAR